MNCPKCNQEIRCGCNSCRKRHGSLPNMTILNSDDSETCGLCGFSAHVDQWLDYEYEQINQE